MCIGPFIWRLSTKGLEHFFLKLTNISKSPFSVHTKWKTNIFRTVFGWIRSTVRTRLPVSHQGQTPSSVFFFWVTFCITVHFFPSPITLKTLFSGEKNTNSGSLLVSTTALWVELGQWYVFIVAWQGFAYAGTWQGVRGRWGVRYCLAPLLDTLCPGLRRFTLDT